MTKAFRKGEIVGQYFGEDVDEQDVVDRYGEDDTAPYVLKVNRKAGFLPYIDSACRRSLMAMVNHGPSQQRNVKLGSVRRADGKVNMVATKRIPLLTRGEPTELLTNYGGSYFSGSHSSHRTY